MRTIASLLLVLISGCSLLAWQIRNNSQERLLWLLLEDQRQTLEVAKRRAAIEAEREFLDKKNEFFQSFTVLFAARQTWNVKRAKATMKLWDRLTRDPAYRTDEKK